MIYVEFCGCGVELGSFAKEKELSVCISRDFVYNPHPLLGVMSDIQTHIETDR